MIRRTFLALPLLAALPKVQAKPACAYKKLIQILLTPQGRHALVALHNPEHTADHVHDGICDGMIRIKDQHNNTLLHVRLLYDNTCTFWCPDRSKERPKDVYGPLPHVFRGDGAGFNDECRRLVPDYDAKYQGRWRFELFTNYALYL